MGHGAFARCRSGQRVGSGPADVMLVFGDVGEMRKVAESADDLDTLTVREAIQCRLELVPRGFIFVAVEADRGPANVFNDFENRLAFLVCGPYRQECGREDGYRRVAANPCRESQADP